LEVKVMMLTSWDPFRSLRPFDRATDGDPITKAWAPAANVSQDEKGYILRFDVPGVAKDEIAIDIDQGTLVVSGVRKSTSEESEDEKYYRVESYSGSFRRSFRLPDDADVSSVSATHKDGVLTVRVPRAESARARKIEIAAA
jgi:HSP20 family protein